MPAVNPSGWACSQLLYAVPERPTTASRSRVWRHPSWSRVRSTMIVTARSVPIREGRQLGPAVAPGHGCPWWVSTARPPNPACDSHRTGLSTCCGRWSAGEGCRFGGPRGRDAVAAVAVPGHGDAGGAGEGDPVGGEPPAVDAESAFQCWPADPVFAPQPGRDAFPGVGVDRAEGGFGHTVPEVVRPPAQHPTEEAQQVGRRHVQV